MNSAIHLCRFLALCIVCSFLPVFAQVTFTGNAAFDFDPLKLSPEARVPYYAYHDPEDNRLGQSDRMIEFDRISGMDVQNIYLQYDWKKDILYVGIDCFGICGDLDGDGIINGDPSLWEDGMNDWPDWTLTKTISMIMWPEPPKNWFFPPVDDPTVDLISRFNLFYPTFVIGKQPTPTDPSVNLQGGFAAFSFSLNSNDPTLATCATDPIPYPPDSPCYNPHTQILLDPPTGYRLNLTRFAGIGVRNFPFTKKIPLPKLFAEPSATQPDIEFTLSNFSNYFNFTFRPGFDPIRFGFFFQMGSTNNLLGFKTIIPQLFSVPCALQDACGVCIAQGGDNSSCSDCAGVPFGTSEIDACGVCGGDSSSCADCAGVPHGTKVVDACGVCGGDSTSCADCNGIPNGGEVLDECGVCGGNSSSCADCAGVPNGRAKLDRCGECNGHNECLDCFGIPFGGATRDFCGRCGGDNSTCTDCEGVPKGGKKYDACGVCGGHNECDCWFDSYITFENETSDAFIDLARRTENFGSIEDLHVSSDKIRTVVKFENIRYKVFQDSPQALEHTEILSATLRLFIRGVVGIPEDQGWEDPNITVHNLNHNFCEDTVSWDCRDEEDGCCVDWKMMGLYPHVKPDYTYAPTATEYIHWGDRDWLEFNVTQDIIDFVYNSYQNTKSYLIKKQCEKDPGWISFWSCEGGRCPELIIHLRTPCFIRPEPEKAPCEEDGDEPVVDNN